MPLLCVCSCNGSMRWVHSECVVNWLRLNPGMPHRCEICRKAFKVVYSTGEGERLGFKYFQRAIDDPELKDSGLFTILLLSFMSAAFLVAVEYAICALDWLPVPGRAWLWMVVDVMMAAYYVLMIVLKYAILLEGGADWKPEVWGAPFTWMDRVFDPTKAFIAEMSFGRRSLIAWVLMSSVRSIYAVSPWQQWHGVRHRLHLYLEPYARVLVVVSSVTNLATVAWLLKRAFLDKQPVLSEVTGKLFRTS